jgi:hypothetical protein
MAGQAGVETKHLALFHLEALRLGLTTANERQWIERHRANCARCDSLAAELDSWRREVPAPPLGNRRRATPAAAPSRRPLWFWMTGALLAPVAAVVLLILPRSASHLADPATVGNGQPDEPAVSAKSAPGLSIVARRGDRVFPVRSGERLRPGDQIRFALTSVTLPYGLIASLDGAGVPNIYFPYNGKASVPLTPGDRLEVEGSIVLDRRLGPERVFALFSRTPLSAKAVREALASIGSGGHRAIRESRLLPVGADAQSSMLLEKVAE